MLFMGRVKKALNPIVGTWIEEVTWYDIDGNESSYINRYVFERDGTGSGIG